MSKHTTNDIRSIAIELLRSPAYLKALEARLLAGAAPDIDYYRYLIFHGPVPRAIKWSPRDKAWGVGRRKGGQEYFAPLHVLLTEAVRLYTEGKRRKRHA